MRLSERITKKIRQCGKNAGNTIFFDFLFDSRIFEGGYCFTIVQLNLIQQAFLMCKF